MKMRTKRRALRRRCMSIGLVGTFCASLLGGCDLGEFTTTTTSTVTLNARDIVHFLVTSAVLTPLEVFINNTVDSVFDQVNQE